jgi:hypothetical protein
MRFSYLALIPAVLAIPTALQKSAAKPIYWLLAGDSTTAPGGGWGDAFLSTTVAPGSSGHNWAKGGATTKSFRDGGYWAKVMDGIKTYKNDYKVYVTIQVNATHTYGRKRRQLTTNSSATTTRKKIPASPLRNTQQTSKTWPAKSSPLAPRPFSSLP